MNAVHHTGCLWDGCLAIQNGTRWTGFVGGDVVADERELIMLYLDLADAKEGGMYKD